MADAMFYTDGKTEKSNRVLYTASEFAKNNLIYLQEAGKLTALKPHVSERHKLQSFLFFTVTRGEGKLMYEDVSYSLTEGSCIFVDCSRKYSHETSADNLWQLSWVHMYGSNMQSIYEEYKQTKGRPVFQTNDEDGYNLLIERIMDIACNAESNRDMLLYKELTALAAKIMVEGSTLPGKDKSTMDDKLFQIREYISRNYKEKIALEDLEKKFNINKYYLTRIFKQKFGTSISNFIIHQRITNVKYLLRFTDRTVEDIGYSCGINDPSYLNRIFKKVEGITPSEFRCLWRLGKDKRA